jgi:hypothetical protein
MRRSGTGRRRRFIIRVESGGQFQEAAIASAAAAVKGSLTLAPLRGAPLTACLAPAQR